MTLKRILVRKIVDFTHGWNHEFHQAIEAKVMAEYQAMFPPGADDVEETISKMRTFYYLRMVNTASLLVAVASVLVAFAALIVAVVALFHQ